MKYVIYLVSFSTNQFFFMMNPSWPSWFGKHAREIVKINFKLASEFWWSWFSGVKKPVQSCIGNASECRYQIHQMMQRGLDWLSIRIDQHLWESLTCFYIVLKSLNPLMDQNQANVGASLLELKHWELPNWPSDEPVCHEKLGSWRPDAHQMLSSSLEAHYPTA